MTQSTAWGTVLADWQTYLRATSTPDTTFGQRTYHLRRLAADFPDGHASVTFDGLVGWLAGHDWAPNTRRAYRGSLRSFWSWLMATGRAKSSPAHMLPPVRVPRGKPRPAPEAAYRRAVLAADDRAQLAIRLAAQCGLRRGEIARTRREDVEADLDGHSLLVHGKGGHERLVPLPDDLAADLLRRSPGWLFPSSHGGHLTPHHLGKIVSRCLPGQLTTHTLRHRCGTVAYRETRDLRAVQELLGHAKPETTALYVEVPGDAVRAAMRAAAA